MNISQNSLFFFKVIPRDILQDVYLLLKIIVEKRTHEVLTWEVRVHLSWFTLKECIKNHGLDTWREPITVHIPPQFECLRVAVGHPATPLPAQPCSLFLSPSTLHSCASQMTYSSILLFVNAECVLAKAPTPFRQNLLLRLLFPVLLSASLWTQTRKSKEKRQREIVVPHLP